MKAVLAYWIPAGAGILICFLIDRKIGIIALVFMAALFIILAIIKKLIEWLI